MDTKLTDVCKYAAFTVVALMWLLLISAISYNIAFNRDNATGETLTCVNLQKETGKIYPACAELLKE